MRVLYIHQYFCTRQGRSGTRSYEFALHLVRQGHHVTMLTSTSDLSDVRIPAGTRVHRYGVDGIDVVAVQVPYSQRMGPARRIWSFLQFMSISTWIACRARGHDVVFASSTPLTVGLPGMCASFVLRRPLVFEVRDLWPEAPVQMGFIRSPILVRLLRAFERLVYRRSRHIVALSPGMRDGIVAAGAPAERITVIPNCSDLDLFHPGDADPQLLERLGAGGRFVVTHAGSMGAANDLDLLLEAVALLQAEGHGDVQFLLLGEGAQAERLRMRLQVQGLRNVSCVGSVPRAEVPAYLRASHVCLVLFRALPVLATNSPNKLFDALAAGRAVIVNSAGWTRELVERHDVGRYAEPGDAASLAAAILWLRDHPEARRRMEANARRLAEAQFDRAVLARSFEAVLVRAADGAACVPIPARGEPAVEDLDTPRTPATAPTGAQAGRASSGVERMREHGLEREARNSPSPGIVPEGASGYPLEAGPLDVRDPIDHPS